MHGPVDHPRRQGGPQGRRTPPAILDRSPLTRAAASAKIAIVGPLALPTDNPRFHGQPAVRLSAFLRKGTAPIAAAGCA